MKERYREKLAKAKRVYLCKMTWLDEKIRDQKGELAILTKQLQNVNDCGLK